MKSTYIPTIQIFCLLVFFLLTANATSAQHALNGKIISTTGHPMPNVVVTLSDGQQEWLDTTGTDGIYLFDDLARADYSLSYSKTGDPVNGLAIDDLLLIQKHLLGLSLFGNNWYSLIAGDANMSLGISTLDIILILRIINTGVDDYPKQWRFLYAYGGNMPNYIDAYPVTDLQGTISNIDFVGIKKGDVDQSANPFE